MSMDMIGSELRGRIAEALAAADGWEYAAGMGLRYMSASTQQHYDKLADAVLAVLPVTAPAAPAICEIPHMTTDEEDACDRQGLGAAEAHPPSSRWTVETYDPLAEQWAPGSRYPSRADALERYHGVSSSHPTWRDGTPVQRRLVRETTTHAVEEPAAEPGAADDVGALLATRCDTCLHSLSWHRNDVGCTVTLCVCSHFHMPADSGVA